MPPPLLIDPAEIDLDHVLVDQEGIRKVNQQRGGMEQLTAIVLLDTQRQMTAGYKDVTDREFWVAGHMPDFPLMPGVVMCEAAAQLASYYCTTQRVLGGNFVGLRGLEDVRFRGIVRPGDRLVLVARSVQIRPRRRALFAFQGFVKDSMVVHGQIIGVPMHFDPHTEPARAEPRQP